MSSSRLEQVCDLMKKMQEAQTARDLIEVLDSLSKKGADAIALGVAAPVVDYKASVQARVLAQDPSILIVKGVDSDREYIGQEIYLEQHSDYIDDGWYIGKRVNLVNLSDAYAVYTYLSDPEESVLKLSSGECSGVDDFMSEVHSYVYPLIEYMSADDAHALVQNYLLLNGANTKDFYF